MTLGGLILLLSVIFVIGALFIMLLEMFVIPTIQGTFQGIQWYENLGLWGKHIFAYIFILACVGLLMAFVVGMCFFMEWADTIVLW